MSDHTPAERSRRLLRLQGLAADLAEIQAEASQLHLTALWVDLAEASVTILTTIDEERAALSEAIVEEMVATDQTTDQRPTG